MAFRPGVVHAIESCVPVVAERLRVPAGTLWREHTPEGYVTPVTLLPPVEVWTQKNPAGDEPAGFPELQ